MSTPVTVALNALNWATFFVWASARNLNPSHFATLRQYVKENPKR